MPTAHDIGIRGGTPCHGTLGAPVRGHVVIDRGRIAAVGAFRSRGLRELDSTGLAVAPGHINRLSWATDSLFVHGRSRSDILQCATLEARGQGRPLGPLNERMKRERREQRSDIRNLKLDHHGPLEPDFRADVIASDPASMQGHAMYEQANQCATGMRHLLVNGLPVRLDRQRSDARPDRVVRGAGARRS